MEVEFGQTYEDMRTHRAGVLLEYDEKYKTYLLETLEGTSFNITSSQFNKNWRKIGVAYIRAPVVNTDIEVYEHNTKSGYKGKSEEDEQEVNKILETFMLSASTYADSFENPIISAKPEISKRRFKMKVRHHTVFIMDCLLRTKTCRVWIKEYASDLMSWTVKPLHMRNYVGYRHNITLEFPLEVMENVLDDLRGIVITEMTESEVKRNEI